MMKYLVGIDVRTQGVDCIVIDEKGAIAGGASESYEGTVRPHQGWMEQHPTNWWEATCVALRKALEGIAPPDVIAVGLSGEAHALVALDENNEVIRNAILISDDRSAAEYNVIMEQDGIDAITDEEQPRFFPKFVESKLKWLQKYEPENYERIRRFILPKDFIRYRLTGRVQPLDADAEKAGFFRTEDQQWNSEIVSNIGFDIVAMPAVDPADEPAGEITAEAAASTGLPSGIPVYAASDSTILENVSVTLVQDDVLGIMLGSSGIAAVQTKDIPNIGGGRLERAVSLDGSVNVVYGVELSCGDSVRWAQAALFGDEDDPARALEKYAERAPIGSHGVIFLPYLMGERSPHIDPNAKAVFYGLSVMARIRDLARAVLEGVVFGLKEIYELIQRENHEVNAREIVLSGGGCRYDLLKHIIADVFGMPVKIYEGAALGTAYGAALTAGIGEGCFASMEAAETLHRVAEVIEPVKSHTMRYEQSMRTYEQLYKRLRKTFDEA